VHELSFYQKYYGKETYAINWLSILIPKIPVLKDLVQQLKKG